MAEQPIIVRDEPGTNTRTYEHACEGAGARITWTAPLDDCPVPEAKNCEGCGKVLPVKVDPVRNRESVVDLARQMAEGELSGVIEGPPITPGRIVYYRMGHPRDGKEAETSDVRVAICINVTSAGATLRVLDPYGIGDSYRPGTKQGMSIGTWHWPPRV